MLVAVPACAHGDAAESQTLVWTFDPWVTVPLAASAILYCCGVGFLWARVGAGRGIRSWQAVAYALGWLALAGALLSPLHWLGEHLFTFHMIEHEIVIAVAAPLIAAARPLGAFIWAVPRSNRSAVAGLFRRGLVRAAWRGLTRPHNATILHGIAIWIWHAPGLFDAAVVNVAIHRAQHLSFLATGLLFWWALIRSSDYGLAAAHLFVTMLHTGVLGALIALAPRVLYRAQTADALQLGLSPLEDQQLAGVVMWVPAGIVYAAAALAFATLWIRQSGKGRPVRDCVAS
jgi:cytochrome c oxidase assembly factor CtaG